MSKSYFGFDAGPSWVQSEQLKDVDDKKAHFSTGVRADLMWGVMMNQNIGLQLQTGVIWNRMSRVGTITTNPPPPPPPPPPTESGEAYEFGHGDLYQIPLLLNVVYKFSPEKAFSPYIGAGAGGELSLFDATFPTARLKDTDITFAYQAFAGVRYRLSDRANIGLGYKFLGTTDQDWKDNGLRVRLDHLFTHAVVAAFTVHF